jgi:hypothetical protein
MTYRQYLIAVAMHGVIADPEDVEKCPGKNCEESVACHAIKYADAVIAALKKETKCQHQKRQNLPRQRRQNRRSQSKPQPNPHNYA